MHMFTPVLPIQQSGENKQKTRLSMSDNSHGAQDWSLEDHIYGTIYGQAVGDTIGLLTEFMSKEQAKNVYGEHEHLEYEHKSPDAHRIRWRIGDWTDDTDQMILIMDSLSDNHGKIDAVDFGNKLLGWAQKGFPDLGDLGGMGIGATTTHVLRHELFTTNPHAAAEDIWTKSGCVVAPNGSVMRTSILGIHQYDNIDAVIDNATQISKTTHFDPRCTSACVAVSATIAYMLQRQPRHLLPNGDYNIQLIMKDCYTLGKACLKGKNYKKHKKDFKKFMFAKNLRVLDLGEKNSIGYTYKTMGAGFWALRQSDFRTAMEQLVFEGGDADTNGAVAGALLGCKLGSQQLPPTWRDKLLYKEWLDPKIIRFLEMEAKLKTGKITAPVSIAKQEEASEPVKETIPDSMDSAGPVKETIPDSMDSAGPVKETIPDSMDSAGPVKEATADSMDSAGPVTESEQVTQP